MPAIGMRNPKFAPFKGDEPSNALPKYDAAVSLGEAVRADTTPSFTDVKFYADDKLSEQVAGFNNATLNMETSDITDDAASVVYGCAVEDQEIVDGSDDTPPLGGLTYVRVLMRKGVQSFQGVYHPKVKATLGNSSDQTKGENITFSTTNTTFTVFAANDAKHTWRRRKTFATEEEANAWCASKLANA